MLLRGPAKAGRKASARLASLVGRFPHRNTTLHLEDGVGAERIDKVRLIMGRCIHATPLSSLTLASRRREEMSEWVLSLSIHSLSRALSLPLFLPQPNLLSVPSSVSLLPLAL